MNIVVYCSSRDDLPAGCAEMAHALGTWIGEHHHTLVYGGVNAGLMHITAQATHDAGGTVHGVIPEVFEHRADPLNDRLTLARDLNDRKSRMVEMGDLFVVLPGGVGTIDEWISTLSQLVVNQDTTHGIIVANINDMYRGTIDQLASSARTVFASGKNVERSIIVNDTKELINTLNSYTS